MARTDALVGKRIREYEILEVIGQGRMGALYRARHVLLDQERAIKVVPTGILGSSDLAERFIREARVLARMRHPNLVELYEFGTLSDGSLFMILELLRGETVRTRIERDKKVPILEAVRVARETALGLHVAHGMGIIHRDVCPDNLYLVKSASGDEITKVIDFAIAKPTAQEARTMAVTPILPGRPEFWSPEQFGVSGQEVSLDPRTDIYSLGVTIYYMVSGRLPFLSMVPKGTPEPLPPGAIPHKLETLIWKAITLDRDQRQQSMMDLIADLDEVTHRESTPTALLTRQAAQPAVFQPGYVFAKRYTIEKKIGRGGMGTVFKAKDNILEIPVALKTINPEISSDDKTLARLKREVILARKVAHPNVCRLFDIGESDGTHYVSMEFVDGMTLSDILLMRGKLPQEEGLTVIRQVLLALQEAHRAGVIHRDLKPQNIMVDVAHQAYIMDFGISFSEDVGRLTTTGMMIGTPRYMAPEQFGEGATDHRADIYSMGIIMYEVFTGRLPFDAKTPASVMYAHLHAKPQPPTQVDPDITLKLEHVILKALEKDPSARYQTVAELLGAVERILADHPTKDKPLPQEAPVAPAPQEAQMNAISREPPRVEPPPEPIQQPAARRIPPAPRHEPTIQKTTPRMDIEPASERSFVIPIALGLVGVLILAFVGWLYFSQQPSGPTQSSVQTVPAKQEPAKEPGTTPENKAPTKQHPQPAQNPEAESKQPAQEEPEQKEPTVKQPETKEPETTPPMEPAVPQQTTVRVSSDPPGAAIFLNGNDTGLVTPSAVPVTGDTNEVELRLQGYEPVQRTLEASAPEIAVPLTRIAAPPPVQSGKVSYKGDYPVSIYNDRKLVLNTAKANSAELPAGKYKLTLVATDKVLIRSNVNVEIKPGETIVIPAPAMSKFQLTATPSNCKIYIDTIFVDVPPIFDFPIQAGNHHVRVHWETLGKEKSAFVTAAPGQTIRLRAIADETSTDIFEEK